MIGTSVTRSSGDDGGGRPSGPAGERVSVRRNGSMSSPCDRDVPQPARAPHSAIEFRAALISVVEDSGIERVDVVAWRDLDDPESGGSELHAHEVLSRWAAAGVDVHLWTSRVDGAAREVQRGGYVAHRAAGRYAVFPR